MEKQKKTKQQLKREIQVSKADNFYSLSKAFKNIDKCSSRNYMGSGITIEIKNINKQNFVVCEEFMIIDGLSEETIEAIKKDIKRAYDLKMSLIPKL
jgi:hypothetical protein